MEGDTCSNRTRFNALLIQLATLQHLCGYVPSSMAQLYKQNERSTGTVKYWYSEGKEVLVQ